MFASPSKCSKKKKKGVLGLLSTNVFCFTFYCCYRQANFLLLGLKIENDSKENIVKMSGSKSK